MASMSQIKKPTAKKLTEREIDEVVTAEASDSSAWEEPVRVRRPPNAPLKIPGELAARATFLARLHRISDVQEWLARIIRERIELEEVAFAEAKRDLSARGRDL
jgi:hypothetical protein